MIKVSKPLVGEEEINAVAEVLKSGNYVSGKKVEEFEEKFAEYIGTEYAVAVNSGTSALHLALLSLGIGKGDKVIVPPLGFFATIEAVLYTGAIPVFADIAPNSFNIDPESIKAIVEKEDIQAIIPVHFMGIPCDMKRIMNIARKNDIYVIEDACQAHGASIDGKKVGSFGDAGCFSFYATKNMTTGEGGMITTDNPVIVHLSKIMRNHGMLDRHTHVMLGYNYRMTEMEAAMGLVQLKKLDELNAGRLKNTSYLYDMLRYVKWVNADYFPAYKSVIETQTSYLHVVIGGSVFYWCPIVVKEEKLGMRTYKLVRLLRDRGLEVRYRYKEPLYRQPVLRRYGCNKLFLPNAERVAGRYFGLPNRPDMTQEELDFVIKTIKEV